MAATALVLAGVTCPVTVQVLPGARLVPMQVSPVTLNAAAPVSVAVSGPPATAPELASVKLYARFSPTPACP